MSQARSEQKNILELAKEEASREVEELRRSQLKWYERGFFAKVKQCFSACKPQHVEPPIICTPVVDAPPPTPKSK